MSPTTAVTQHAAAPDPRGSEEMRHLMQRRLALLGIVGFALASIFLGVELIGEALLDGVPAALSNLHRIDRLLNISGALVPGIVWLLARTGVRTPGQLLGLDALATVAAIVPYSLMAMLGQAGSAGVFLLVLVVMLILQTRALMIPSDVRRTLGISSFGAAVAYALAFCVWIYVPEQRGPFDLAHLTKVLTMWFVVIVAVCSVASWLLFGLRTKVQEARRLGQYILLEKIGEGAMGVVYLAQHALLRRPTAVKLLPPSKSKASSIKRFEREVQLTASLQHPNTVTVLDYGRSSDGVFYYVMEYLDGGDLDALVAVGGPMPPGRVVHLMTQIAAGLAEAHEIGLIHRDVKPANILVNGLGAVADVAKLVDFGLVQDISEDEMVEDTVVGTPLFFSPEAIIDPTTVDARADIYALGGVAYYLLTGRHVFERKNIVDVCADHVKSIPPPPSDRVAHELPEMLEEVILRCLEKDPDHRPQSAQEFRDMLEACDDVGTWTHHDARAWWAENGDAVRRERGKRVSDGSVEATMAVDLEQR